MTQSTIQINVGLDENKIPSEISWIAPGTTADSPRKAKAFLLSLWDGSEKTALRIDLWTRDMMVDEMEDFFYQTLMTMADTYQRATQHPETANDMRQFARDLYTKSKARQLRENKL
jgi:gliding motility-associated protein GldC